MSKIRNLEFTYKDDSTEVFENIKNFYKASNKFIVEWTLKSNTTTVSEINYHDVKSYRYV